MSSDESKTQTSNAESRPEGEVVDSSEALLGPSPDGRMSNDERLQADKNSTRQRRSKLQGMASKFGLSPEEVKMLAAAGMMMPDPFEAMMITDLERRVDAVQEHSRMRVQYTNMIVPLRNIEDYIHGLRTIKIDSQLFIDNGRSLADLMIAVRGSAKIMDGIGTAYAEQYALHKELLRLVVERQQMSHVMRQAPPKYLIDFARLLESLGCDREKLRSVNGPLVRLIREHMGLSDEAAGRSVDDDVVRFESWLSEDDALADLATGKASVDKFDRLSRVAAKALMDGDLEAARTAFADLETTNSSLVDSFGLSGEVDLGHDEEAEASPIGQLDEADNSSTAGASEQTGDNDIGEVRQADGVAGLADRALTEESNGGVSALPPTNWDLDSSNGDNGSSEPIVAIPPEPAQALDDTSSDSASDKSSDEQQAPRYITGWGITAPEGANNNRASGIGRVLGIDAFGGIVSMSAETPEVIPMWARENRKGTGGDRLTMDDWYRFEVPYGPYALVHMPKPLRTHSPVQDEMFPPYEKLERYGEEAGFSPADMHALKMAESGRAMMEIAMRAVRSVLMMKNGGEDDDLLRFWMFLLVGRKNMDRIDVLFPQGYFHGVWAPDPAAREAETGFFRLVRVLDDGDLADRIRQPQFGPFGDQK